MKIYAPLHRRFECFGVFLLLITLFVGASAQSTELEYPTPVRTNEISGTIAARDVGDPRLTRYYYSFTGTPGDLIVTAEGRNLDGDVDVFTAGALRPLAKVSFYAGGSSSGGSKTIYLKTREALILRVEARTPNDNEGSFRVRFEGAFEPIVGDVQLPEPVMARAPDTANKKTRRVSAVGARIEEPEPEPTVAKTQPELASPSTEKPTETPSVSETPATTAEAKTTPSARPRTPRTRRSTTRSTTARPTRNPRPAARAPRTTTTPPPVAPPPAPEPAASGPRLIIETRDGMKVERYMTTVRRVTVERGQLVVVTTEGKVERQPMSNVLRMAIEP